MRVTLKAGIAILASESASERDALENWIGANKDHVFHLASGSGKGAALHDMGVRAEACREPINIVFAGDARWRPISNLAHTPFQLHDRSYASVEGFWQGLKTDDETQRWRIAALWGSNAKRASNAAPPAFVYREKTIASGTYDHWELMFQACRAKFAQNLAAREALLATGARPLTHRTRRDSRIIPGALMADIWMRVRASLSARGGAPGAAA